MRQQFHRPHFANGLPLTATVREVLPLFQLRLHQGATHAGAAVLIDAISEVLAGHADNSAFPALKARVVNGQALKPTPWTARHATPRIDDSGHQGNAP